MDKAEKIYKKKLIRKQNQFGKNNTDWRNAKLNDPDDDTTDTEDEDDNQDTNKFLSLMENAKKRNSKVSIKWSAGQLKVEKFNDGFEGEIARRQQEKKEVLMKKQLERRKLVQKVRQEPQSGGKRKFEDRMTLNEAKLEDFDDTQDYVNFIQAKLQGVRIKLLR